MNKFFLSPINTSRNRTTNNTIYNNSDKNQNINKYSILSNKLPSIINSSLKFKEPMLNNNFLNTTRSRSNTQFLKTALNIYSTNYNKKKAKKIIINNKCISRNSNKFLDNYITNKNLSKLESSDSLGFNLNYKIISYTTNHTKNISHPDFNKIDIKLKQKYLKLAKNAQKEEKINDDKIKNVSENTSLSEGDEFNLQKNIIAQKILTEDRKKTNFFQTNNKFEIDKNQLNKIILSYSNNKYKGRLNLNKFIKEYNSYISKKEFYNNQKIRMNTLRSKYIKSKNTNQNF